MSRMGKQTMGTRQQPGFADREVALACCSTKLDEAPCSVVRPHSHEFCTVRLRPEDVHGPYYILPADGALAHPLPAFGTGDHVTTLQQHAVDDGVHADSTQVLIGCQLGLDTVCWREEQRFLCIRSGAFSSKGHFNQSLTRNHCSDGRRL